MMSSGGGSSSQNKDSRRPGDLHILHIDTSESCTGFLCAFDEIYTFLSEASRDRSTNKWSVDLSCLQRLEGQLSTERHRSALIEKEKNGLDSFMSCSLACNTRQVSQNS